MTATNHALTGALIGLSVHQPLIAIPLALISHYFLDAIPHMGGWLKKKSINFRYYLYLEAFFCGLIVLSLVWRQPNYWLLSSICAFVATSPDFMWVKGFLAEQSGKRPIKPHLWFVKLHAKIQWFEKPIGAVVELAWAVAVLSLLAIIV